MPFKLTIEEIEPEDLHMDDEEMDGSEETKPCKKKKHRRGMTLGDALAKIEN